MSQTSLIILNLPVGSFFGLNLSSFNTTDRFRGIKNIPPGLHFIYFSAAAKSPPPTQRDSRGKIVVDVDAEFAAGNALGTRYGFFVLTSPSSSTTTTTSLVKGSGGSAQNVILKKWDTKNECVVEPSDIELENVYKNIMEIQREYLAPYENLQQPSVKHEVWRKLTKHVDGVTLDRIFGEGRWECESTLEAGWEGVELDKEIAHAPSSLSLDTKVEGKDEEGGSKVNVKDGGVKRLGYSSIDLKKSWPPDAVGRERTVWARDKSWALGEVLRKLSSSPPTSSTTKKASLSPEEKSLLAELSISIILSVLLANYSSTSQFKGILELSLSSQVAIRTHPGYFKHLLELISTCLEFARLAQGEDDAAKREARAEEEEADDDDDDQGGEYAATGEAVLEEFISGGDVFLKDMLRKFGRSLDYAAEDDRDAAEEAAAAAALMTSRDQQENGQDSNKVQEIDGKEDTPKEVIDAFAGLKQFTLENFSWHLDDSYVRRGMLELPPEEGGGSIFVEMEDMEGEDERGEYAPVIVEM